MLTPKFCPQCGATLQPEAKFCPACGLSLAEVTQRAEKLTATAVNSSSPATEDDQAHPAASNQSFVQIKQYSGNFFSWVMATLRHPTDTTLPTQPYFGIISLTLTALLITLANWSVIHRSLTAVHLATDNIGAAVIAPLMSDIFGYMCLLFLAILVLLMGFSGLAFVFTRTPKTETRSFLDFTNQFAGLSNLMLVLAGLSVLLGLVMPLTNASSFVLLFLLFSAIIMILEAAYLYTVSQVSTGQIDGFYRLLLAELAIIVVFTVITAFLSSFLAGSLWSLWHAM